MKANLSEIGRYLLNGLIATVIHFGILSYILTVLKLPSAAIANIIAAVFGISVSFLGSRYFVFSPNGESFFKQAVKFSGLYCTIAILHGIVLYIWTDWRHLDYRFGFLIATGMQVALSYFGNRFLVFKK
jgi:putative flippase GtrA